MPPKVTVVVATFNRSDLLPLSIGSVLRQTFRDFELLVVGDGCTDDSEEVVGRIDDPRVRWIGLPTNSGHQSTPNNEGLRQARGEIIAYLGHDDLWLPHHLESHVGQIAETGSDAAYSLCVLVAPNGTAWPANPEPAARSFSPPSCMTHRREMTNQVGGWRQYRDLDERRDTSPEVELWRRAHAAGKRFSFVRRLTGIKFPASWRRGAYSLRRSDEQQAWLARIDGDPHLETTLLMDWVTGDPAPSAMHYSDLLRLVVRETGSRIRRRLAIPRIAQRSPEPGHFDRIRRFKGL